MTDLSTLSARARKAYDILVNGGQYCHALVFNSYTGRSQFQYGLLDKAGHKVNGYGGKTFYEIETLGVLRIAYSTSVSSYYNIR